LSKSRKAKAGTVGWNLRPPCSEDTKEKIRLANLGKLQSKETREKRSRALKGRLGPMKGRVHSEEVKKKISLSNKSRKRGAPSELTKKKISETLKNKKYEK
jgi:hypothetical protein